MPDGPTVYLTLEEDALDEMLDRVRNDIEKAYAEEGDKMGACVARVARDGYRAGVRDGYVQGVAAEAAKHNGQP